MSDRRLFNEPREEFSEELRALLDDTTDDHPVEGHRATFPTRRRSMRAVLETAWRPSVSAAASSVPHDSSSSTWV